MSAEILIVGQGLAGTLLAWELERAGLSFAIADRGHASAASLAGAGIVNPITGRRLVKSGRVDELLPLARTTFRELEAALGVRLWREVRVRRLFADERERRVFAEKQARGELAPFATAADEPGFWIEGAGQVDATTLLHAARERWRAQGRLIESTIELRDAPRKYALTIDCSGASGAGSGAFGFVPWEFSKGELIEIAIEGLAPDVVLSRRHWVLPVGDDRAWVGATHEPGVRDATPGAEGRAQLVASAAALLGREFRVVAHRAGVRVTLPDKRPVAGRHPENARLGVLNGLGAKGALWAPFLARQWARHLAAGLPFDPEIAAMRFAPGWSRPSGRY